MVAMATSPASASHEVCHHLRPLRLMDSTATVTSTSHGACRWYTTTAILITAGSSYLAFGEHDTCRHTTNFTMDCPLSCSWTHGAAPSLPLVPHEPPPRRTHAPSHCLAEHRSQLLTWMTPPITTPSPPPNGLTLQADDRGIAATQPSPCNGITPSLWQRRTTITILRHRIVAGHQRHRTADDLHLARNPSRRRCRRHRHAGHHSHHGSTRL